MTKETENSNLVLEELKKLLNSTTLDTQESLHFTRDLERVKLRLKSGEYKITDFSENYFDIPRRTQEFFSYLNSYHRSAESLATVLNAVDVNSKKSVLDLCPGWAPKVGLALVYLNFRGKLVLVDYNEESLRELEKALKVFNPSFLIEPKIVQLPSAQSPQSEVVVANHVLDDLLLFYAKEKIALNTDDIYKSESELKKAWQEIHENREELFKDCLPKIISLFSQALLPQGVLIITQYCSYFERVLELEHSLSCAKELFNRLKTMLEKEGFKLDLAATNSLDTKSLTYFDKSECLIARL